MTLGAEYFAGMYEQSEDPWGFRSRWYERRKRALTLASLPDERYGSVFEPGCSVGLLTDALAGRCDRLLATDVVPGTVEVARRQVAAHPHARVEVMAVPREWPEGERFDLVVLSEVAYYLGAADLRLLVERLDASLAPGGAVLACHWRHPVADYPGTGDVVHAALRAASGLVGLVRHEEEDFLLDVLARPPAPSVARRTGLV